MEHYLVDTHSGYECGFCTAPIFNDDTDIVIALLSGKCYCPACGKRVLDINENFRFRGGSNE